MQTDNGEMHQNNTTDIDDDLSKLERDIHDALVEGVNVQETVHRLTLKAMKADRLDIDSIRRIVTAVTNGIHEGAQQKFLAANNQTQTAKSQITAAISGLDSALARLAEASKLAVLEAADRAQKFSEKELVHTRSDLESLESLFLDTLQNTASAAKGTISDILQDITKHAKNNGTIVGEQLKETLATFAQQAASVGHAQIEAGAQLTQTTAGFIHKIATGVLSGIKDHSKHKH
ncbi:hypothetical protein SAMN05216326_10831 [Nitrosomonas marina]|uniref:Uncharacterized protein n=1 Tax=Nitrosomonas marina TaxID=917 RepID=A0A1I0AQX6_9PROT|nr:DUF6781 family protein [Nitrosomonas marina]SES96721.1 hypothetical protein SAMN05216326_10831 [Nitrosomonas marina]